MSTSPSQASNEQSKLARDRRFDIAGKVALITGGARGLGRDMSIALVEAGAKVYVTSRDQQAGADIADALVTGAEGAGNLGDELSEQLDQIGPSAEEAASGLGEFSGAAETAGEGAETAGGQLAEGLLVSLPTSPALN